MAPSPLSEAIEIQDPGLALRAGLAELKPRRESSPLGRPCLTRRGSFVRKGSRSGVIRQRVERGRRTGSVHHDRYRRRNRNYAALCTGLVGQTSG